MVVMPELENLLFGIPDEDVGKIIDNSIEKGWPFNEIGTDSVGCVSQKSTC